MLESLVYVSRLVRLTLTDAEGATIGHLDDVVIAPPHNRKAPQVLGFVAVVQRRRIFVNAARVDSVDAGGVRLRGSAIDLRHFELRPGEILARELLDQRVGSNVVHDLAIRPSSDRDRSWEVAVVAMGPKGAFRRRRSARVVPWSDAPGLFDAGPIGTEVAGLRAMHPSDIANAVRRLPLERRRQLAEALEDERLADVLEELPEEEQLRIVEGLDLDRLAHVLEEMDPDDAADLLSEMPRERRAELLEAMEPEEAGPLRRLLVYGQKTAGGLMTPEPVVALPDATVAEVLARLREPDLPVALATQVFVTQPPTATPTGTFLGVVGIQRLLREAPSLPLSRCLEDEPAFVDPDRPELEVAARLAAYDLAALAVCDMNQRLLGVVTVDDILDHMLPVNWRQRSR